MGPPDVVPAEREPPPGSLGGAWAELLTLHFPAPLQLSCGIQGLWCQQSSLTEHCQINPSRPVPRHGSPTVTEMTSA